MKTKYPSMFGVLAALLLVASFIIPTSLASPTPVQAGVCKWTQVEMPGSILARFDVGFIGPTDVQKIVTGNDGVTVLAVVNMDLSPGGTVGAGWPVLLVSPLMGILWSHVPYQNLANQWTADYKAANGGTAPVFPPLVFDVAIAPDNPAFWAVVVQDPDTLAATPAAIPGPTEVYVTENAGGKWTRTRLDQLTTATPIGTAGWVGAIDISVDYGGQRDIAVGMRLGNGTNPFEIWVLQTAGFAGWNLQTVNPPPAITLGDVYALKFSPTYPADGALAVVFTTTNAPPGTYYNVALRDIDQNDVNQWSFPTNVPIAANPLTGTLPNATQLISADLELPSDFNGQAASLRRAYVSTDTGGATTFDDGVYRIDNTTVYVLMDTTNDAFRRVATIAYFGTYASGKLLAGSVMGYRCEASVPTWFTDSPTTCPVPCWYDCLKCPTGAALCEDEPGDVDSCIDDCVNEMADANAQVAWFMDGAVAWAATGTYILVPNYDPPGVIWWLPFLTDPADSANDETAISISRNNGETWNQLAFIDTTIDAFNDVAVSADCQTLYLASWNDGCNLEATCTVTAMFEYDCPAADDGDCTIDLFDDSVDSDCVDLADFTYDATCERDPLTCLCTYNISGNFTVDCCGCEVLVPFTATGNLECGVADNVTVTIPVDCSDCCAADCCLNTAFDSVWRTSLNAAVVGPLPPMPPLGYWYERVYTRPTALSCCDWQSDLPILRLAGACEEPTGQIVGWAAQGTQAEAWSPDYGDYWANITARFPIQDFAFESQTILYNLYVAGTVQKMPYTGTAWSTTLPAVNTGLAPGHTIAAMPEGKVLVGFGPGASFPAAISVDGGATFAPLMQPLSTQNNIHVAFDPDFNNNSIIYIGNDGTGTAGHVYRTNASNPYGIPPWGAFDMMSEGNNNIGCPSPNSTNGIFGIALAYTGGTLYAADGCCGTLTQSGVWRTLDPLAGIPKPGVVWDRLDVFAGAPLNYSFTLEPSSLKLCGCCTLDSDTTLWALDNNPYSGLAHTTGFLWSFTDCLAKKGPALVTEDKMLIGCDPVSGRAQEVNLCWEQLCVAGGYDIEIAKNDDFSIKIIDWVRESDCDGFFSPASVTTPCAYIPAGGAAIAVEGGPVGSAIASWGNLECGHTYYWRVRVRACVTTQVVRSPWSDVRSFTVKAGLPVTTPYYGPQLLAPNNGCLGCPVSPVSFSWSPFKETTKYKFVLAQDAAMTQVVTEAECTTTAFEYDGTLDYSTNYFWRVMSLEPAPSDWSATFSFQTEAAPPPVTPAKPTPTPIWVWVVIAIGAILVIVTLVLIFKTRRV
jgi:hypothetical protein